MDNNDVMGLDMEINNTPIDELDSEVVNLIFVAIDQSGSMHTYQNDMENSLSNFKDSIKDSKESDTILISRANFMDDDVEISGYKKINEFDVDYFSSGQTPLYDVIIQGVENLTNDFGKGYMDHLKQQGMRVKSVFAVFSDGDDTSSNHSFDQAREKIAYLNKKEIVTACVCFGDEALDSARRLGFKNILPVNSSASELRKAFDCLSKSVAENSKSVVNKVDDFFDV